MTDNISPAEITKLNRIAWDKQVDSENEWTRPVGPEEIARARKGDMKIILTPSKGVPNDWLFPLTDRDVLLLAGGGGQQAPLIAAAGARVTTLDNSPKQLEQDQLVAKREGLVIKTVLGLMEDLSAFQDESFDLIVHPCSNCFTPDVTAVWREAFRVLRPGGSLLSGFNDPLRFIFDYVEYEENKKMVVRHRIPYSDMRDMDPDVRDRLVADGEPMEFGHSLNDQIGGQLAAGFQLTGFFTDDYGETEDPLSKFIDTFIATRATKPIA